jgi:hypothetical protein
MYFLFLMIEEITKNEIVNFNNIMEKINLRIYHKSRNITIRINIIKLMKMNNMNYIKSSYKIKIAMNPVGQNNLK